jgi:hypothetical protein
LGAAAYYVDYENASFDRSPVIFAEADNDAAVGEVFAETLNFSVTNESSTDIETGEWLWGVAVPQSPLFFTMTTPLTTNDWRTNQAGVVAPDTADYILFTSNGKLECWTGLKGGLVIGATYRMEITLGNLSTGTVQALTKRGNNANQGTAFLSGNTAGADQPYEFVATDTVYQQNLKIGSTATLQCGVMAIYGPLAT